MELGPGGLSAPQGAAGTWRTGPGTATAAIRRYAAALWRVGLCCRACSAAAVLLAGKVCSVHGEDVGAG